MPIYEYQCKKCGKVVESFQKASDPGPKTCAKCGGRLSRVISHTSFQLKGGGWYKDLYASAKPEAESKTDASDSAKPERDDAKPEAKSDAKSDSKPEAKAEAKGESKSDAKSAKPEAKIEAKKPSKEKKAKAAG